MHSRDRLLVPFPDRWIVELQGPVEALALVRELDCTDYGPAGPQEEREIAVGQPQELEINACQHLVFLTAPPDAPGHVRLRIDPAGGG
jgi:hypothetical protein